jgi:hypothetical protein
MRYEFTGDKQPPNDAHPNAPQTPEPYIAGERLKRAVNLAIHLERPLLLEGEAGCGKTRLARAVAHELGLPFYPPSIRGTSTRKPRSRAASTASTPSGGSTTRRSAARAKRRRDAIPISWANTSGTARSPAPSSSTRRAPLS